MNAEDIVKAIVDFYSNTRATTPLLFMGPKSRGAIRILERNRIPIAPNYRIAA